MTYERLKKIAKAVGAKFENHFESVGLKYFNVGSGVVRYTTLMDDGSVVEQNSNYDKNGTWFKEKYSSPTEFHFLENISWRRDRFNEFQLMGTETAICTIETYQIKEGIEKLKRKPIFVGTRRVSGMWIKQGQQIVKPSGVYVKQNGTIKKM